MDKVTPWFPPSIMPVYIGPYEAEWALDKYRGRINGSRFFNRWDGRRFCGGTYTPESAALMADPVPLDQWTLLRWRGLSEPSA